MTSTTPTPSNKSLVKSSRPSFQFTVTAAQTDSIKNEDDKPSRRRRGSLFHHPEHLIAFAPPSDNEIAEDVEAIAQLSRPKTADFLDSKVKRWKLHHARKFSDQKKSKSKAFRTTGKVPLPLPYKKHRADLAKRRAERSISTYRRDDDTEYSEKDLRVKTPCCGVICFHALELIDLVVNKQSFLDTVPISYFCLLSIGPMKRCTKIVHAWDPRQIKMDYFVHLSVDVSEWREAPNNKLRIELWSFQDPEAHFIVGTVEIHIYNFIKRQHTIETIHLMSDGIKVGKLAYEVAFSYGAFGYGHSNQLKNFSQPIMETISHSMFPRIKLDDKADIADTAFQARLPDNLKLFTYHSLILEVDDHPGTLFGGRKSRNPKRQSRVDLEAKPMVVQQVDFDQGFPIHCKLHMNIWQKVIQPDFNDMFGEYICIGHKRGRLDYLTNMVQGRMRDLYEEETGPLFKHLKQRDLDHIHRAEKNPAEIVFPKSIPCPSSQPFKIQMEDQQFQDKFPVVRRQTGYLSRLFGLQDEGTDLPSEAEAKKRASADMAYLKSHKDIPSHDDGKRRWRYFIFLRWIIDCLQSCKRGLMKLLLYVFPMVEQPLELPDVSLTVATPEGSTTNIFSYFSREAKDNVANSKVARLVKQTTQLIQQTKRSEQHMNKFSTSDSSSSSNDDEANLQHLLNKQKK